MAKFFLLPTIKAFSGKAPTHCVTLAKNQALSGPQTLRRGLKRVSLEGVLW